MHHQHMPEIVVQNHTHIIPRDLWSLLLVPFIIGLMTVSYLEGLTMIMLLYGLGLSGMYMLYALYTRLEVQPEVFVYCIWIAWSLGGLTNAIDRGLFVQQFRTIVQIGVLIFVVAGITAMRRNLSPVMFAVGLGGFCVALSSIVTGEFHRILFGIGGLRSTGLTGNANEFAYCMVFAMFTVFYFSPRTTSIPGKVLLAGLALLAAVSVVYSGSRKGLVGMLAFFVLWWLFSKRKTLSGNPLREYVAVVLILGIAYFAMDYVVTKTYMGMRIGDVGSGSNRMRVHMYQEGLRLVATNPVWGVGLDNFRLHSSSGLYSHSDYIEVASTTGIIGFLLYFSIYGIVWHRLNSIRKMTDNPDVLHTTGVLKAALLTILLIAFGRPNITSKLTWIFLAGAAGYTWSLRRALMRLKALTADDRGSGV